MCKRCKNWFLAILKWLESQLGSRKDLRSCLHFNITENDSWQLLFKMNLDFFIKYFLKWMLKLNLSASFTYSLTPTTSNLVNIESKWFIQLFSPRSNYIRGRWGCMMILRSLFVLGLLIGHNTFLQPIRNAVLCHTINLASVAESWGDTSYCAAVARMDHE